MENNKEKELSENCKVTGLFIQIDENQLINIQDLCQKDYENFLNAMNKCIIAYNVLMKK